MVSLTDPVVLLAIVGVLAGVVLLWGGARVFVDSAVTVARGLGISDVVVGLTVVAVGTSLPEIAVAIEATLDARPNVAVGSVVGSNTFNVAVVLGSLALVRVVPVSPKLLRRDALVVLGVTLALLAFVLDLRVTRVEGLVLLGGFVGYLWMHSRQATYTSETDGSAAVSPRTALALLGSVVVVLVGAQVLIWSATELASSLGVSEWVISSTVVAAGTSIPEAAVSLVAIVRNRTGVSVGNVLGSNVVNTLVVLGLAAVTTPLGVAPEAVDGTLWLTALTGLLLVALWSGSRLSRPEGGLLVVSELVRWALGFR